MLTRAVLDTNIIYAGMRSRHGASFAILDALSQKKWTLLTVLTEYEEILKRESRVLNLANDQIEKLLDSLCALAERHTLTSLWLPVLQDPDHEFLIHLAVEAKADYLVTHNIRHLTPAEQYGVNLVAPREFLAIIKT